MRRDRDSKGTQEGRQSEQAIFLTCGCLSTKIARIGRRLNRALVSAQESVFTKRRKRPGGEIIGAERYSLGNSIVPAFDKPNSSRGEYNHSRSPSLVARQRLPDNAAFVEGRSCCPSTYSGQRLSGALDPLFGVAQRPRMYSVVCTADMSHHSQGENP